MSFSIRLHTLKCLEESSEWSSSDEPYVLVTCADLRPPTPGIPSVRTFRYGAWEDFDKNESIELILEPPFWGMDLEPQNIPSVDELCIIVSMMENDGGKPDAYRGTVELSALTNLATTISLGRKARVDRLVDAINTSIELLRLPTQDDRVGTKELRLDGSDLIPVGSFKDKVLEFDGGSEGKWVLSFRIVHHRRNEVFGQSTRLAAVSRQPDLMELWAVGGDGILRGNWFHGRWHGWYMLPGEQFNPGTHLAAIARHPERMEVWAVGQDGIVRGIPFENGKWRDWYKLPGASFPDGAPLAAVSRHPDRMEIWGVDLNGKVRNTWFEDGEWHPKSNWGTLDGAQFKPGAHLTAASLSSEHMEVWVVGDDRPILGNRFDGKSSPLNWQGWYSLEGASFSPGANLVAVVRKGKRNMHVFAVDLQENIQDFWFEGTLKRGWYQAGGVNFNQDTPLAVVSRNPDHKELLAIDKDGMLLSNPFEKDQWKGWFQLHGNQFSQPASLAAVSRNEGHMEVWAVWNGIILGNGYFDGSWHGWYPLIWSFEE